MRVKEREKELSGSIMNLLDTNLEFVAKNGSFRTTIPATSEYGTECRSHFGNSFDEIGEVYGKINGCFRVYYPALAITANEKVAAEALECKEPDVPKSRLGKEFFIVPRIVAIKAIIEKWQILPQLLIPANPVTTGNKHLAQGFVLAILLEYI